MHNGRRVVFVPWVRSPDTQGRVRALGVRALGRALRPIGATAVGLTMALSGCSSSSGSDDAGPVKAHPPSTDARADEDAARAADGGACRPVGHYEAGKEGSYLPCCAGLHEDFPQVAAETTGGGRICTEPVGYRNYVCVEGRCGDGRCEAPESLACGCSQDCASTGVPGTDAGGGAIRADAGTPEAGVPSQAGALVPSLASVQQSYLSWTRHTEQPQPISTEISALCRMPTSAEAAFVESPHGNNLYLLNWLNDAATRGNQSKADRPFPVGAAIVKQKLTSSASGDYQLFALGVMIKHEPGFDPAHGDWEFGYWTPSEGLSSGRGGATQCGGCHAGSKTDFVFLDQSWRR